MSAGSEPRLTVPRPSQGIIGPDGAWCPPFHPCPCINIAAYQPVASPGPWLMIRIRLRLISGKSRRWGLCGVYFCRSFMIGLGHLPETSRDPSFFFDSWIVSAKESSNEPCPGWVINVEPNWGKVDADRDRGCLTHQTPHLFCSLPVP